ncbi:uncharacterized protein EURHEDRAFT_250720 [Aspergillus ruber CBS 135680]|uniref:Uncharacterized protein n=1 Tax=Aspergillus ruber (strain CBS 135680) TaxID=1388766 RepID=A0A017S2R0_ASPRC|nr:uncharacterized protein EURHEDRAFT_250720 [Aspergillus ruber CBS 135680]EYE91237.1 hypothetical protein EURHEDRAFT_250720 [Aspergillus ruber CBS 135680]
MRTFIFIVLAGLLTAAVARPFQREPSPAGDAPVSQTLSSPSTLIFETSTSTIVPDSALPLGEPGYGVYSLLVTQAKLKPTSVKRIRLLKRQEYHILPEPNDQAVHTTSTSMNGTASINATQSTSSTNFTKSVDEPPTATPVNLVPHWNTEEYTTAFAVIFIIVVVVAFVVLLALYFKKTKMFFQRRRRDKKSLLSKYNGVAIDGDEVSSTAPLNKESKSDRGAYSFEINRSRPRSPPPEYIVEEDPQLGSVTRVYRVSRTEYNNGFPRRVSAFHEREQENRQENEEQEDVVDISPPTIPPTGKLRESVQKPVLIVPTPLNPLNRVRSFSATTELQQHLYEPVSHGSQDDGDLPRNSTANESRIIRYSDPGPYGNPNRTSFLPRIQRSSSPLFTFDDE